MTDTVDWLLQSDEPWIRYRTLVAPLERREEDGDVRAARADLLAHPLVSYLIDQGAAWPGYPFKRYDDARHPIHALSTLADFGLRAEDPGMPSVLEAVLAYQSEEGVFQSPVRLYERHGGVDGERWTWLGCDASFYSIPCFGGRRRRRAGH